MQPRFSNRSNDPTATSCESVPAHRVGHSRRWESATRGWMRFFPQVLHFPTRLAWNKIRELLNSPASPQLGHHGGSRPLGSGAPSNMLMAHEPRNSRPPTVEQSAWSVLAGA